ncbi:carboxylesterase family protein [Clostridium felsineum]|uniref:Carboxylic ester hydrolase n=1 Tax=Clostridium felsineum TaxID=36839 RepID=A0A1S8MHH6_9CLOT|nr:carboxylesterase family protein [Clostridium felsineum]URZ07019.1 Para-nitrobenzyl esterase [Clostridium felsineum]URZ12049.1 Para-nitrobenzyl esterase [Clostridium felsineum]
MKKFKKIATLSATLIFITTLTSFKNTTTKAYANHNKYKYTGTIDQATKYGTVEGLVDSNTNTLQWLGVPYAKAPIGSLRWKAPQDLSSWTGIKDAKKFGNVATQLDSTGKNVIGSEDCLYLNIWRPNTKEKNLPVLLFAHGGGNITGSGASFQGDILANRTNSIVISINYRLGAMGWFLNDAVKDGNKLDDSGNYGLLDIFKSLDWVNKNISDFGGNPDNVTLSGQSAGARDVIASLISPLSKGLYEKAMPMSGGMTLTSTDEGKNFSNQMIEKLLVKQGKALNEADAAKWIKNQSKSQLNTYLKSVDSKELVSLYGSVAIKMNPFPHLYKDGYVIPKDGFNEIKKGNYNNVPIIVGSMSNEFTLFSATDPYFGGSVLNQSIFNDPTKSKIYTDSIYYGSKLYSGFNADNVADLIASSNKKDNGIYAYRCGWGTQDGVITNNTKYFAAAHGLDIDLITGHYNMGNYFSGFYTDANKPGRDSLGTVMDSYLKNFLYTGNPNGNKLTKWGTWQTSNKKARIMKFDATTNTSLTSMSKEHLVKQDIIDEMNSSLPKNERDIIVNSLFNGRFFWQY